MLVSVITWQGLLVLFPIPIEIESKDQNPILNLARINLVTFIDKKLKNVSDPANGVQTNLK